MPAGIPKRLTDEMARLGYTLAPYNVEEEFDFGDHKSTLPVLAGMEMTHRGRIVGVVEHEPRGWGGDDKWRVCLSRSTSRKIRMPVSGRAHVRQRDAIAELVRVLG